MVGQRIASHYPPDALALLSKLTAPLPARNSYKTRCGADNQLTSGDRDACRVSGGGEGLLTSNPSSLELPSGLVFPMLDALVAYSFFEGCSV